MAIVSPPSTHLKPPRAFTRFHTFPSPSSVTLHRLSARTARLRRCLAASPGPPHPPPRNDSSLVTGLTKFQDRARIFFAVLFWMSLFFWASAWDKSNGRPKKGPRFKR